MKSAALLICTTLSVYDGDTFRCNGESMRPMGDGSPYVAGFDTPEIGHRAKCELEEELGQVAKARFEELLRHPGVNIYDSGELDPFDRKLVWVILPDGRSAGSVLIEEGLARVWSPQYRADWCANDTRR